MSSPPQNTTTRLKGSATADERPRKTALRWLSFGAPSTYQLLEGATLTLGRAANADVVVDASGVSRQHAELRRQGPIYALRDLGSTNGTYVNGVRVEHSGLSEGDVVRFGSMVALVSRIEPESLALPDVVELAPDVLIGPSFSSQLEELRRIAPSDLPVLIWGETGVGKECVARAIHLLSGRSGPFHAVNCAALPPALAEAELFGHRRGAFTGAEQAGLGHLRAADGGTLLLDELPDLPESVQAKLLRALQERCVTPLGDTRCVPVNLRLVAACQQSPTDLVQAKRLRQDLVARLNGLTLEVPPLRRRRADVAVLFGHFLNRHSGGRAPAVEADLLESLLLYDWPSNVRELELLTRRLLVQHGHSPILRRSHLPSELRPPVRVARQPDEKQVQRREHDRRLFADELRRHDGNIARAAAGAGISRQRAYRLLGKQSVEQFLSAGQVDGGDKGQ
jgi:transcriptional regulator with PAS, ATPase and Fis domain